MFQGRATTEKTHYLDYVTWALYNERTINRVFLEFYQLDLLAKVTAESPENSVLNFQKNIVANSTKCYSEVYYHPGSDKGLSR